MLVAVTLNDVPIDVLAERLGTTRGALYKTLHDARRKLRAPPCRSSGLDPDGAGRDAHERPTDDAARRRLLGPAGPGADLRASASSSSTATSSSSSPARDADAEVPGMRAHLDGCPACREEHESLRALLDAER